MEDFKVLFEKAECLLKEAPSAQQVISVKTAKGNVYHFLNSDPMEPVDEERFLSMLQEKNDVHVEKLVCVWQGGAVDLPHIRLRKCLLELCPENAETDILLMGEGHYVARKLSATMPC